MLDCREVTPAQARFPGARLIARLRQRVGRKAKRSTQIVYLISSLSLVELQALGRLKLKRNYWVIKSRLHHPLDVSLGEDQSRVRHANAALVLGMFRRVVVSCARAWLEVTTKTRYSVGHFLKQFARRDGGPARLWALVFAATPPPGARPPEKVRPAGPVVGNKNACGLAPLLASIARAALLAPPPGPAGLCTTFGRTPPWFISLGQSRS